MSVRGQVTDKDTQGLGALLCTGQTVHNLPPNPALLHILHEDEDLLVVNKPSDLVCHPSKKGPLSSFIGRVREYLGPGPARPSACWEWCLSPGASIRFACPCPIWVVRWWGIKATAVTRTLIWR